MNNEIIISRAKKGLIVASYKTLKILENSKYSNDLRTWNNPDRVGMLDLFLATLNPKIKEL